MQHAAESGRRPDAEERGTSPSRFRNALAGSVLLVIGTTACGDAEETPRVILPVATEASGLAEAATDLGYRVALEQARLVLRDVEFTMAGEAHSALWNLTDAIVRPAYAHPGHLQNGDATGLLPGRHVVAWSADEALPLGDATLLVGSYASANFTFGFGETVDGLAPEDPLLQHSAWLRGTATRDGETFPFEAIVDAPPDRALVGIPFAEEVTEHAPARLAFRLLLRDPLEGDTLFDGIDFAALATAQDGALLFSPASPALAPAYDVLRRRLLTHDHYAFGGAAPGT